MNILMLLPPYKCWEDISGIQSLRWWYAFVNNEYSVKSPFSKKASVTNSIFTLKKKKKKKFIIYASIKDQTINFDDLPEDNRKKE